MGCRIGIQQLKKTHFFTWRMKKRLLVMHQFISTVSVRHHLFDWVLAISPKVIYLKQKLMSLSRILKAKTLLNSVLPYIPPITA